MANENSGANHVFADHFDPFAHKQALADQWLRSNGADAPAI